MRSGDPAWVRWGLRAAVAAFLVTLAGWGWRAGLDVRDRAWQSTRTIRFNGDIRNAMHWGNRVLRTGEALADHPDAPTDGEEAPPPSAARRRLTFWQVVRGEGRVYADLMEQGPDGDFELDYPPLRLLTMSLWVRSVQDRIPNLTEWPGGRRPAGWFGRLMGGQAAARATEDVAAPLLRMNAVAAASTAVLAFGLTWLWVDRGGRRNGVRVVTPLRRANGLVLFPVAAAAFAYAAAVAVLPAAPPPPAVAVTGPPVVSAGGLGRVFGWVDPQGADARWHVEWGPRAGGYDHATDDRPASAAAGPAEVSANVPGLPVGGTVHYRLVARNDSGDRDFSRGTTRSDDATMLVTPGRVQPAGPGGTNGAVWLSPWQWAGVGVLFAAACGAMRAMPAEHRGWAAGLMAAIFTWFDPALLVDGHVWPQWDGLVLPPFLAAALLASLDWWLAAGVVLGAGAMFKGQLLLGSPVLILWPVLSLRWAAAGRLVVGALLSAGLIVSPWLVLNDLPPTWGSEPLRWVAGVLVAGAVGVTFSLYRRPVGREARRLGGDGWRTWRARRDPAVAGPVGTPSAIGPGGAIPWPPVAAEAVTPADAGGRPASVSLLAVGLFAAAALATVVTATLLILRRWPADAEVPRSYGAGLLAAVVIVPWVIRRRSLDVWAAAVLVMAVWGGGWLYRGDWSWKTVGFEYGARKFDHLGISRGSGNNLGSVLNDGFGWETHDPMLTLHLPDVAGHLFAGRPSAPRWLHAASLDGSPLTLDVKQTMLTVYFTLVVVAAGAAAVHARRGDVRFLAAVVVPWLLMPNLLAQMMNRYEMWGAVLSSMLIGISSGLGLLHVLVSLLAAGMIGAQLLVYDPGRSPVLQRVVAAFTSSEGGVLLLAAVVVLFVAVVPTRRDGRRPRRQPSRWPAWRRAVGRASPAGAGAPTTAVGGAVPA